MDDLLKKILGEEGEPKKPPRKRDKDLEVIDGKPDDAGSSLIGNQEPGNSDKSYYRKLSVEAAMRMQELGFDPMEQAIKIARGEALTKDHPFLPDFKQGLRTLRRFLPEDNVPLLDNLMIDGELALTDSFVPLDIRSRHTADLLGYLYPKKRSIEHAVNRSQIQQAVTPLTKKEVAKFEKKFRDRY